MEYYVDKRKFKKEDIEFAEILFDNGDCFPISKTEIMDISIVLYDKLILGQDDWNSFCAVAKSGFIKLKLQKKINVCFGDAHVYNSKDYNRDRIAYITNRLCSEGGISCIKFYNKKHWRYTLHCQVETIQDGEFLTLKFLPLYNKAEYKSYKHTILLPEVGKLIIRDLELYGENCQGVYIDQSEILEMQLKFKSELCCGTADYSRQLDSGYLKIRLNSERNAYRKNSFTFDVANGQKGNKQIINIICGKRGFCLHNICQLHINYDWSGFDKKECIEIKDARSDEEISEIKKWRDETGYEFLPCFLGGYAEKLDKDTFLITFGKMACKDERCKKVLQECSIFNLKSEGQ